MSGATVSNVRARAAICCGTSERSPTTSSAATWCRLRSGWPVRRKRPALVVVTGALLGYRLRNYPEERAVARFLTTLEGANFREAYRLWQPSPSYGFGDFMHDWGEQGDYGKLRQFEILGSKSKGSDAVIVTEPTLRVLTNHSGCVSLRSSRVNEEIVTWYGRRGSLT